MRVVTLLPAATEIVAALGGPELLVGVTHECDHPPAVRHLPSVTTAAIDPALPAAAIDVRVRAETAAGRSLFRLDERHLASLHPDVLITQAVCAVCAVSEDDVREIAARLSPSPTIVSLDAHSLEGVFDDIERTGRAIGLASEAAALSAELRARLARVHATLKQAKAPRPRVAVIEWLDPAFMAGHWVPEMVHRAGGVHLATRTGEHSRVVSVAEIEALAPDIIVFAPCGFNLARGASDARALLATGPWDWARARSCWALDGNALTSRPGPRLATGVEVMAAIFHPSLFPAPEPWFAQRL